MYIYGLYHGFWAFCMGCAFRMKVSDRGEAILSFGISGMDELLDLEPGPPPLRRFDFLLLALAMLLGFSLRLYIARAAFATSFDSSTVGLMAMRILEGDRPLFYYGQLYMGSLEAYVAALMFAVFGVSTTVLALAPILFSVALIVATYFLFREISVGERWVSFAAALSVAASSVHGLWYTLATYGGYPEYLFFGTMYLWLSLRLAFRSLSKRSRWTHALGLGVIAALAVWTHLASTVYIATGLIVMLGVCALRGFRRGHLVPLLWSVGIGCLGFIPFFIERTRLTSMSLVHAPLRLENVPEGWDSFLRLLQAHLWAPDADNVTRLVVLVFLLMAAIYYVMSLILADSWITRAKRATPLLFALVFIALFSPHPMAQSNAPRYLLPIFTMAYAAALSAGFLLRFRVLRVAAILPVVVLSVFQVRAALIYVSKEAPKKDATVREMRRTHAAVQNLGLKHIYIVGNEVDGHMGQEYTFYAKDSVKFVSLYSNRTYSDEISAECDPRSAFLVQRWHSDRVRDALYSAGVIRYKEVQIGRDLFYDIRAPHFDERSIRPKNVTIKTEGAVRGDGTFLFDRNVATRLHMTPSIETQSTAVVTIDMGESMVISGVDIDDLAQSGAMRHFGVEVSRDGERYYAIRPPADLLSVYSCGNKVYMLGLDSRWQLRIPPTTARYVRVTMGLVEKEKAQEWSIYEMYVMSGSERTGPVAQSEVKAIRADIDDLRLSTVAADRWLSYQLGFRSHGFSLEGLIPHPNRRYKTSIVDRNIPCQLGVGFVVSKAYVDEAQDLLVRVRQPGLSLQRKEYEHYTLFYWKGTEPDVKERPSVYWTGEVPLHSIGPVF